MYLLQRYQDQVRSFLCSRSRKSFLIAWVVLAAILAGLALAFIKVGAPAIDGFPQDVPVFLDGGWRLRNGQVPHKDFYVYFGDLIFYVVCLGVKLGSFGLGAITTGNVVVMAVVGLLAMLVLRGRTSAFYAGLFTVFLALLAVTPRPLGAPFSATSYAMVYNRYGETVMALLCLVLFLPSDPSSKQGWAEWADAGLAGFFLALLLFCKVNYFGMGIAFLAAAVFLFHYPPGKALAVALSAALFLWLALVLTGIPFAAMRQDYAIVAAGQSLEGPLTKLVLHLAKGFVFLVVLLALAWEISSKEPRPPGRRRHFALMLVIFVGEGMVISANFQPGEMPLLAVAALYGAEIIRRQSDDGAGGNYMVATRNFMAAVCLIFFLLPTFSPDVKTIRHIIRKSSPGSCFTARSLQSTALKDFRFIDHGDRFEEMKFYAAKVDEGMELLRRHADPAMRLNVFLFSNPYQVALRLAPAEGGIVCWSYNGVTVRSHPPLKRLIGNANYILTGGGPNLDDGNTAIVRPVYGEDWAALNLETVEKTEHFTLFKLPEPHNARLGIDSH